MKNIRWLVEVNDRPKRLVESLSYRLKLTEAEQQKYFGAILNG